MSDSLPFQTVLDEFQDKAEKAYADFVRDYPEYALAGYDTGGEIFINGSSKVKMATEIMELREQVADLKSGLSY